MPNGSEFSNEKQVEAKKEAKIKEWQNKVSKGEKITYADGSTYDGHFDGELRQGEGILIFKDGAAKFEGFFHDNKMSVGKITYGEDVYFNGTFDEENKWSDGFYRKGNATYHGLFANQQLRKDMNYIVTWGQGINEIVYNGPIVDKADGQGYQLCGDEATMTYPDSNDQTNIKKIKGWQNNEPKVRSFVTMRDGSIADNYNAKTGKLEGQGQVKVGKHTYDGVWDEEGKLNGEHKFTSESGATF